jgi:hypothetical protein
VPLRTVARAELQKAREHRGRTAAYYANVRQPVATGPFHPTARPSA